MQERAAGMDCRIKYGNDDGGGIAAQKKFVPGINSLI
jgi:hypothetical protein